MIYLSGHISAFRHPALGFIVTPRMGQMPPDDVLVAVDTGCYSGPEFYSDEKYLRFLEKLKSARTLFATAPDVVGDHHATVERSVPMLRRIRETGLPTAFVAQDGWKETTTPWPFFDVLFIGGSTKFKFRGGRLAAEAAHRHGKRVHMGRVNGLERLRAAKSIGCMSADGTFLKFGPDKNVPRLVRWLNAITTQGEMRL